MPRVTELDRQWQELMSLCQREQEFISADDHPKLLRFVSEQIDQLAAELGFPESQIRKREFRAEKDGGHISRILLVEAATRT